jgi:hypothetical protein
MAFRDADALRGWYAKARPVASHPLRGLTTFKTFLIDNVLFVGFSLYASNRLENCGSERERRLSVNTSTGSMFDQHANIIQDRIVKWKLGVRFDREAELYVTLNLRFLEILIPNRLLKEVVRCS